MMSLLLGQLLRSVLLIVGLTISLDGWSDLPYESFIVDDIGYKMLTENTVAVTDRAQERYEYYLAGSKGDSGKRARKKSSGTPLIGYEYRDIIYTGKVVIPATVTYDGITYTVTEIGNRAFIYSENMTSLTIPYSVTKVADNLFNHRSPTGTTLNELIIEDADTELNFYGGSTNTAFSHLSTESLYLGRNITGLAVIPTLKTVTIGDHVTSLESGMFQNCDKLTTVHFGANIASMGEHVFMGCTSLAEIALSGSKLTTIPHSTFYNCTSLKTVILPQGLTSIEETAFNGCSSLTSIDLPQGLTSIGVAAFGETALTQINIPNSVTMIKGDPFYKCLQLKEVVIEDGDTELSTNGARAFEDSPLDSLYLGRNLSDNSYFSNNLRILTFGDKVTKLGYWSGHTNLAKVHFGKNISSAETRYGFRNCTSLKHIDMTSKLTTLPANMFEGCTALESVVLPANLTWLNEEVFKGCTSLKNITIPEKVWLLAASSFTGCTSLERFIVPQNVTCIGQRAFFGCTALKDVVFEDGEAQLTLQYADGIFQNAPLDSVYLGRNLRYEYYDYGWKESSGANVFPASLKKLGIGSSVTSQWHQYTFRYCTELSRIYPLWEQPIETNQNMFPDAVYTNATLLVPGGTMKKYRATAAWNQFANIVPTSILVTMTANVGGSIRLGDEVVSNGTKLLHLKPTSALTFEIEAEDEYYLERVTVDGEDMTAQVKDGRLTPAILSDELEVVATFKAKPYYDVTVSASAGGTVKAASASVMWGRGTTVTMTPDEGHELKSVTVNGVDVTGEVTDGVLTLNDIRENKTIVVTFQKFRYTVTATAGENGSIRLSTATPEWGDDVTVTITPAPHYNIERVLVNGEDKTSSVTGNTLTLRNVRSAMTVEAAFCIQTFSVTASANRGGSVVLSAACSGATGTSVTAEWGTSVTVTLLPDEDYEVVNLYVNGVDVMEQTGNDTYTITHVEANMSIEAVFKKIVEITLLDGVAYNNSREKQYETLHYSRTFKNTNWQAWYVPFDLTLTSEVMQHFAFAKFAGTYTEEDGSFYITVVRMKEGDVVKANTSYCVQAKVADKTNPQVITQAGATLKAAEETSFYVLSAEKKITFKGNYSRRAVTEADDNWYALSGGQYSRQLPGNTIAPFRCFFTIEDREDNPYASTPNPAEVRLMVLGDETDGIEILRDGENEKMSNEAAVVYDLSGRPIVNGTMKKTYEQPVVEELATELECEILVGSNIGEGGEGQEGDVRNLDVWSEIESESISDAIDLGD